MKFTFISAMDSSPWGGSEELWSQAALRLLGLGHETSASVAAWPVLPAKISNLMKQGINVSTYSLRPRSIARKLWNKATGYHERHIRRLMKDRADLVVISQGGICDGLSWMGYCAKLGQPFVVVVQSNSEWWWPNDNEAAELARAYHSAQKVFCVSRSNLKLLERQLGDCLPNALIVRNPFNVSPDQVPLWPVETGIWRFACVARLDPAAKGQDLLFQVLAKQQWRDRQIEVNIYGTGPCEVILRRLAGRLQLKTVHFRGQVNNIQAIWEQNHMLLLPSRYEGLPLALVESMWCGRPAVVTDVAGNTELCIDGKTGFVAAAPTAKLLEHAMEIAWERRMEWHKIGMAARTQVEQTMPKDPVADFCNELIACASVKTI